MPPAMPLDSICLGVHVDGVCAVGCNCQKVLAAMDAVKASLGAARLQCSEVEADASRLVMLHNSHSSLSCVETLTAVSTISA